MKPRYSTTCIVLACMGTHSTGPIYTGFQLKQLSIFIMPIVGFYKLSNVKYPKTVMTLYNCYEKNYYLLLVEFLFCCCLELFVYNICIAKHAVHFRILVQRMYAWQFAVGVKPAYIVGLCYEYHLVTGQDPLVVLRTPARKP